MDPRPAVAHAAALDWLKALAIVAVVVTHAGPFAFGMLDPVDYAVRVTLVAFHVPVFLLVSGYLHATATPLGLAQVWRRLRKVMIPYAVASLVVTVFALTPQATWPDFPRNLLLGNAVPIYYYVFVWCGCVVSGLLWSRCSASGVLVALALVLLASAWRAWHPTWHFFWAVRDPLLQGWAVCYLGGWCARRFGWLDPVRRYRVAAALLAVAGMVPWLTRSSTMIATDRRLLYAASVAALVVAVARTAPTAIRWLSRETLLVYLWHLPVLEVCLRVIPPGSRPLLRIACASTVALAACVSGVLLWRVVRHPSPTAGDPSGRQTPLPVQSPSD